VLICSSLGSVHQRHRRTTYGRLRPQRPVYSDTTQLNLTRRRVVDTFTAWTTAVADQFWTSWPSWLSYRSLRHIWHVLKSLPGDGILEWRIWRKVNIGLIMENTYRNWKSKGKQKYDWPASRWLAVRCSTGSVALSIVGDSWVASVRVSIATQLNSTRRRVELRRYKRALSNVRLKRLRTLTERNVHLSNLLINYCCLSLFPAWC